MNDPKTFGEYDGYLNVEDYPSNPELSEGQKMVIKMRNPDNYEEVIAQHLEEMPKGRQFFSVIPRNSNQIKSATDNTGSFDPNDPDIRYRVTPSQDAEYMSAVEAGDMDKAERMVRDAAMAAGYNLEAYHGTDVDFNEFKRRRHANGNIWGSGFYFADSEDAAAGWGERAKIANSSGDYKVLHTYLSVHNTLELYGDRFELGL